MDGAAAPPPINQAVPSFNYGPVNQAGNSFTTGPAAASVSVVKPNPPVNLHMPPSEINLNVSSLAHGSSLGNNLESRRYNSPDAPPQYARTESNLGLPHTHKNKQTNPVLNNGGLIPFNETSIRIVPIAALNPYQGRWTIKARVTAKGELRHYKKPAGDVKVFSFDLLDSDNGEIKATCFNTVAEQFYSQIEVGKVYMISNLSVRPAQKNFNHLPNDYEIFLENTSVIQPCFEDENFVPKLQFRFRPISEIQGIEKESVVDVIGVMSFIGPSVSATRKNGSEIQKRALQLKDMSSMSIYVTLWGNLCNAEGHTLQNMYNSGVFPVVAVRSCKVNDFNGKCLGSTFSSQLLIEPDLPEALELKAWFETAGKSTTSISISRQKMNMDMIGSDLHKTISQIKDERLGISEKPDWITVCATLTFIKADNVVYTACPLMFGDRKCHKKVTSIGDGKWRCDRCCQFVNECEYRYAFQFQIQDYTGLAWVTPYQESGEEILGVPARYLYRLKYEEEDNDKFAEILHSARFMKYVLKLRVKEETFGDDQRFKFTASNVEKVNFALETKCLLDVICKSKEQYSSLLPLKAYSGALSADPVNSISESIMPETASTTMNHGANSSSFINKHVPSANLAGSYRNQLHISMPASSPSTIMCMRCSGCGGTGHNSTSCPSLLNAQGQYYGGNFGDTATSGSGPVVASSECFKCHQVGHWAEDCPMVSNLPLAYGNMPPSKYDNIPRQH